MPVRHVHAIRHGLALTATRGAIVVGVMLAGAVALPAASSHANIFAADGVDPRRFVTPQEAAWRRLLPVGVVSSDFTLRNNKGVGYVAAGAGTAFMVSPCYAMTGYHVVFGRRDIGLDPMAAYPVTVRFGGDADGRPAVTARGQVRYWGSTGREAPDLALIRLDGCPGRTIGWYDLAWDGGDASAALTMPSYSRDRSMKRLSVQQGCGVRAFLSDRGWALHDCASREGASGAPLVVMRAGLPLVIAVNAGELTAVPGVGRAFDPRQANWAVALRWIDRAPRIRAMVAQDLERARAANPLASGAGA